MTWLSAYAMRRIQVASLSRSVCKRFNTHRYAVI